MMTSEMRTSDIKVARSIFDGIINYISIYNALNGNLAAPRLHPVQVYDQAKHIPSKRVNPAPKRDRGQKEEATI